MRAAWIAVGGSLGTLKRIVVMAGAVSALGLSACSGGGSGGGGGGGGGTTYAISGQVMGGPGVTVSLSGASTRSVSADGSGNYRFDSLPNGTYTVTPSSSPGWYTFAPVNASVTVNGANVTQNFSATPQLYSISGNVAGATSVTVTLTGVTSATTTTDGSGNYSFNNLPCGNYMVAASKTGQTFMPSSMPVWLNGANYTQNFSVVTHLISGIVVGGTGWALTGVTVSLTGDSTGTTTDDGSGNYSFNVPNGLYTVTPSKAGYTFSPASRSVTVSGANVAGQNFSGVVSSHTISGNVTTSGGSVAAGVTVSLTGASTATATTDGSGNYTFSGLIDGSYLVTPSMTGYAFTPANRSVTVAGADVTGQNFTRGSSNWNYMVWDQDKWN